MRNTDVKQILFLNENQLSLLDEESLIKLLSLCKILYAIQTYTQKGGNQQDD